MASLGTTVELYTPRFNAAIALHARSLILLMALAFAVLPAIVFRRRARPFAAHAVFSLHLYGFMLLLFCLATAVPAAGLLFGGVRSSSRLLDGILSVSLLVACGIYRSRSGRCTTGSRVAQVIESIGLTVGLAAIVWRTDSSSS
jgi:hypothetical protein